MQVRAYNEQCEIYSSYDPADITINYGPISAPGAICYSGSTVSVQNVPPTATITWGGTNVSYPNGNTGISVTVRAAGQYTKGAGTITASVSIGGILRQTITKNVWVGGPDINNVTVYYSEDITGQYPDEFCPGDVNELLARVKPLIDMGITSIYWDMGSWDVYSYDDEGYVLFEIPLWFSDHADVYYEVANACDVVITSETLYEGYCGGYYMVMVPNPASVETTLTIGSNNGPDSFDENEEWEVEVYDNIQNLKKKETKLKGNNAKIQSAGWKEGVYVVRVKYKDQVLTGKLVVKK